MPFFQAVTLVKKAPVLQNFRCETVNLQNFVQNIVKGQDEFITCFSIPKESTSQFFTRFCRFWNSESCFRENPCEFTKWRKWRKFTENWRRLRRYHSTTCKDSFEIFANFIIITLVWLTSINFTYFGFVYILEKEFSRNFCPKFLQWIVLFILKKSVKLEWKRSINAKTHMIWRVFLESFMN